MIDFRAFFKKNIKTLNNVARIGYVPAKWWITFICILAFFILGLASAILGPIIPTFSHSMGIAIANAGIIRVSRQFGQFFAIFIGGRIADRYSYKTVIILGSVFMSLGLLFLPFSENITLVLCFVALWGIGHGLMHIGIIVLTNSYSPNFTNALTILNIIYGIGAIISPFMVEYFKLINWKNVFIFCALISGLVGAIFITDTTKKTSSAIHVQKESQYSTKIDITFIILMFISNGANCGIADWIYTHIILVTRESSHVASMIVSLYWLSQVLGRIICMLFVHKIDNKRIIEICGIILMFGSIFLSFSNSLILITVGTIIASIGYAPMYPIVLALGEQRSAKKERTLGYLSSAAAFGAIIIPFMQGKIGRSETGGMKMIFICSVIICSLIMYKRTSWNTNYKHRN